MLVVTLQFEWQGTLERHLSFHSDNLVNFSENGLLNLPSRTLFSISSLPDGSVVTSGQVGCCLYLFSFDQCHFDGGFWLSGERALSWKDAVFIRRWWKLAFVFWHKAAKQNIFYPRTKLPQGKDGSQREVVARSLGGSTGYKLKLLMGWIVIHIFVRLLLASCPWKRTSEAT